MKRIFLLVLVILTLSGCGGKAQDKVISEPERESAEKVAVAPADKKTLVVYFSRTGEEYNVGNISKGNTAIVAEFIAQKTGADIFEIKPVKPYPNEYEACTELAKQELELNARPAIAGNVENLESYDTIFVGYPIWWGELPRVMLTFLESNDLSGKKIISFCTHGGSGLANTEREIRAVCPKAEILSGLAVVGKVCQSDSEKVRQEVNQWLQGFGY